METTDKDLFIGYIATVRYDAHVIEHVLKKHDIDVIELTLRNEQDQLAILLAVPTDIDAEQLAGIVADATGGSIVHIQ